MPASPFDEISPLVFVAAKKLVPQAKTVETG
jgi:hypothetical protein